MAAHALPRVICITSPDSPELSVLEQATRGGAAELVAVGQTARDFAQLDDAAWHSIDVLLNCGARWRCRAQVRACMH